MTVPPDEIERRVAYFSDTLRARGFRMTEQRREVVREIASTEAHPAVETVFEGVRGRVPSISLDTVYRTLRTLAELGLISRVAATPGVARYDANASRHHHFVCVKCGLVRDVVSDQLDAVRAPDQTTELGAVESVEVNLRGVCTACESEKGV